MGEPAPTDFLPYFRINFLPHFTIAVGAGLLISLIATDNCLKPAHTPQINALWGWSIAVIPWVGTVLLRLSVGGKIDG
jgi:hypothetical protein